MHLAPLYQCSETCSVKHKIFLLFKIENSDNASDPLSDIIIEFFIKFLLIKLYSFFQIQDRALHRKYIKFFFSLNLFKKSILSISFNSMSILSN